MRETVSEQKRKVFPWGITLFLGFCRLYGIIVSLLHNDGFQYLIKNGDSSLKCK